MSFTKTVVLSFIGGAHIFTPSKLWHQVRVSEKKLQALNANGPNKQESISDRKWEGSWLDNFDGDNQGGPKARIYGTGNDRRTMFVRFRPPSPNALGPDSCCSPAAEPGSRKGPARPAGTLKPRTHTTPERLADTSPSSSLLQEQ